MGVSEMKRDTQSGCAPTALEAFAIAVAASSISLMFCAASKQLPSGPFLGFMLIGAVAASRLGGFLAALITTAASLLATPYAVLAPVGSLSVESEGHLLQLVITGLLMLVTCVVTATPLSKSANRSTSSGFYKPTADKAPYSALATVYNREFGPLSCREVLPILERVLLPLMPSGGRVLDLCCGTGQLTRALVDRGFEVIGIDDSPAMLAHARQNAPSALFIPADMHSWRQRNLHAVVCVFNSLAHILTIGDLGAVFRLVHGALREEGLFFFDLYTEEGYRSRWGARFWVENESSVCLVRSSYAPMSRLGTNEITVFHNDRGWRRSDTVLRMRCHNVEEIRIALVNAGFEILSFELMNSDEGRTFWLCRKPATADQHDGRVG